MFQGGILCVSYPVRPEPGDWELECYPSETDIVESQEDGGSEGPLVEDGALSRAVSAAASSSSAEVTKHCAELKEECSVN